MTWIVFLLSLLIMDSWIYVLNKNTFTDSKGGDVMLDKSTKFCRLPLVSAVLMALGSMTSAQAQEAAAQPAMEEIIIVGWDQEGTLYIRGTVSSSDAVMLLELAKHTFMQEAFGEDYSVN